MFPLLPLPHNNAIFKHSKAILSLISCSEISLSVACFLKLVLKASSKAFPTVESYDLLIFIFLYTPFLREASVQVEKVNSSWIVELLESKENKLVDKYYLLLCVKLLQDAYLQMSSIAFLKSHTDNQLSLHVSRINKS